LSWLSILALVGATVLNIVTFAPPWMACLPGLGFLRALTVTQASTATTYVAPGGAAPGMAVSFAMLRAWGYTARQVAVTVAVLGRGPVGFRGESLVRFRSDALDLLRTRWHIITVSTLAGQLSVFFLLYVTVRVIGIGEGKLLGLEIFAAWSVSKLLGSVPITPGGIGVIELGLTALLVGFGGPKAQAVGAVLVYRFLPVVPSLA